MSEITLGELGVLAADPDLTSEGEVIADEDFRASHEASGIGLVVRVTDPDDPAVVAILPAREVHLEETGVASSVVRQGVVFSSETKASRLEL